MQQTVNTLTYIYALLLLFIYILFFALIRSYFIHMFLHILVVSCREDLFEVKTVSSFINTRCDSKKVIPKYKFVTMS